ncbi:hypothetical protein HPP92_014277 [Vanilla planifolia]|uniref:ditrans,polycis-polyprenyl diphosphate synthase [(2E,6E)-farnesyldiphosphate specific] n=1 Tax=Vanilla planifolia TaxID=51239 RepID=A0A835QUM3_VANPL|nr:hypothetical protein HPP92_014277 [Vanilla planifolia]
MKMSAKMENALPPVSLHKLRSLAIVVDSKEARNTLKVKKLLSWLSRIGVKYVTLYDMEGILKKSLAESQGDLPNGMLHKDRMMIELLSFIDSKEGIAKAASFLCNKYLRDELGNCEGKDLSITESDISDTLNVIGCGGPEPDLLLVYGPVRCHLGFPAWRLRYTEIIHMGSLNSMKYGDILTALYEFSKKKQNYGT